MNEYDWEPVRGLPGRLPPGEHIIWQGGPDWRVLMRSAFHGRLIAIYFAVLVVGGLVSGTLVGAAITLLAMALCFAVIGVLAWSTARTTVYTLTNKRVVLRIGVALTKCINLPLKLVKSADIKFLGGGNGDISLTMNDQLPLGYMLLWPHARPWKLKQPQPMLRSIAEADVVAAKLARACAALVPVELAADIPRPQPASAQIPAGVAA